jgi:hypothetical protein
MPNSKLKTIQHELDAAKVIVKNNMSKAIDRGIAIDVALEKSDNLRQQSSNFQHHAVEMRRNFCWRYWKMILLVFTVALIIIGIIIAVIYARNR